MAKSNVVEIEQVDETVTLPLPRPNRHWREVVNSLVIDVTGDVGEMTIPIEELNDTGFDYLLDYGGTQSLNDAHSQFPREVDKTLRDKAWASIKRLARIVNGEIAAGSGGKRVSPQDVVARDIFAAVLVVQCKMSQADADTACRKNLVLAFNKGYEAQVANLGKTTTPEKTMKKHDALYSWCDTEAKRLATAKAERIAALNDDDD